MAWARRLLATVSLAAVWPAGAEATTVRGQVVVPAAATTQPAKLNPYPGRAGSLSSAAPAPPSVTDAVVYVERIPEGLALSAPASPSKPELEQRNQAFGPRVLAVTVGTTVEFPNRDPIYHNVFSVSPAKRFDLGKYPMGQSRRVRFDKLGLINVYCDIHSNMAAYVLVLPHHVFARPNASGRFVLPDLPGGTYTLCVWHPDFGTRKQGVEVPASGEASFELRY